MGKKAAGGAGRRPTYYQNYILREDEHRPAGLLSFQTPYGKGRQAHPDELLFIAIHQTYELWFKVAIDEILRPKSGAAPRIHAGAYKEAARTLRRLTRITNVLREQYEIVGTISPTDFLVFRDVLRPSSGYDSAQFRALELASGLRSDGAYIAHLTGLDGTGAGGPLGVAEEVGVIVDAASHGALPPGPHCVVQKLASTKDLNGLRLIQRALAAPSLRDVGYGALLDYANAALAKGSPKDTAWIKARASEWSKDQAQAMERRSAHEIGIDAIDAARVEWAVSRLYRRATAGKMDAPGERALFDLVEALMDYDQAFRNLRTTHIHMVLRVIGGRPGTGGSTGAQYLRSTLDYEFFPLLWRARDHVEGP